MILSRLRRAFAFTRHARVPIPEACACQRCGRRDGLDAMVSDAVWAALHRHWRGRDDAGGLLCLWCMDALAADIGLPADVTLYFAGQALVGGGVREAEARTREMTAYTRGYNDGYERVYRLEERYPEVRS